MKKQTRVVRLADGKSYVPCRVVKLPPPPDPQFAGRPIFAVPRGAVVANNKDYDRKQIRALNKTIGEMRAWRCEGVPQPLLSNLTRKYNEAWDAFFTRYGEKP
jgi:hypothetical protein